MLTTADLNVWFPKLFRQSMRNDTSHPLMCFPEREDYFECLHGRKEHKMVAEIAAQERIMKKQNRRYQDQEKVLKSLETKGK
jgi:hypothetical protein